MPKSKKKFKINNFSIKFILAIVLFFSAFGAKSIDTHAGGICCISNCGSCHCPVLGNCWYNTETYGGFTRGNDYCVGHNFVEAGSGGESSTAGTPSVSISDWNYAGDTRYKIITTVTPLTVRKQLYIDCTICGGRGTTTLITSSSSTAITYQYEYRHTVDVYYQQTDGGFSGSPNSVIKSGWSNGGWFSWSENQNDTYYSSNTHGSEDSNISNSVTSAVTHTRRIYRKQYYLVLNPNPQSNTSTPITNRAPAGWSLSGSRYIRACYVGSTVNAPTTDNTFRMIGYSSNGWYDSISYGNNFGTSRNWVNSISGYNNPNDLYSYNVYAHWCSEPGRLYLMPNSKTVSVNSCYAGYVSENKNVYLYDESIGAASYDSNTSRIAFDTGTRDLPDVSVTNVTVNFTNPDDSTVDYPSKTTNVAFSGWTPHHDYGIVHYYSQGKPTGYALSDLSSTISDISGPVLTFHGTLSGTLNKTYTYNHGDWGSDNKGANRNSIAVSSFDGSWNIVLANAYKHGYLFTGWYNGDTYVGMAGDTIDLTSWVETHNTGGSNVLVDTTNAANGNLETIDLIPHFEAIDYKVLYVMNIPSDSDSTTSNHGLQSHTLLPSIDCLPDIHSLVNGGSSGTENQKIGSLNPNEYDYSYIGTKTYTYDGLDWTLENMPITVNDYYFTGWTYSDIAWTGYGGVSANGITLGSSIIGGNISDAYDVEEDYSLKTLSMQSNVIQNVKNNLPHAISSSGPYVDSYTVDGASVGEPQTDGTNVDAGSQASGKNHTAPTVYIVLSANWTSDVSSEFDTSLKYNSNNGANSIFTVNNAYSTLISYIDLFTINNANLSSSGFGSSYGTSVVNSIDTAVGDTSDDGSYDSNSTSDIFVVDKDNGKYYSGLSNARNGFFSFQGWSTWRYSTWRDAIDSNKKDTDNSELQIFSGKDASVIKESYSMNASSLVKYHDVTRSKRVGDLFYRMAGLFYPIEGYNTAYADTNANGNMLDIKENDGNIVSGNYSHDISSNFWDAYKWRWTKGTTGNYSIPIKNVLDDGVTLYAVWDAYPTSKIMNTYCYIDDIETLTPEYLFSKVTAVDYEDFWDKPDFSIGGDSDWKAITSTLYNMDNVKGSDCISGDYAYTYSIGGSSEYLGGEFTTTLVGYDFSRFEEAKAVDDVASVSVTYSFVDSAGNTTYKTAWVYIIDSDDTDNDTDEVDGPDNVRYGVARFISSEFYNLAEFDADGNYIVDSAMEEDGSLLTRSKWYMVPSYRNMLSASFTNLEAIGNSSMEIDFTKMAAVWSGNYHPQFNYSTMTWDYGVNNDYAELMTKTKGIYVLDYNAIVNTKKYLKSNGYDTGSYSNIDNMSSYINEIFGATAIQQITD